MARFLRRQQASNYLLEVFGIRLCPRTLAKMACQGTGPKFRRDGRTPIYDTRDLDEYAEARLTPPAASTAAHDAYKRLQKARGAPDATGKGTQEGRTDGIR